MPSGGSGKGHLAGAVSRRLGRAGGKRVRKDLRQARRCHPPTWTSRSRGRGVARVTKLATGPRLSVLGSKMPVPLSMALRWVEGKPLMLIGQQQPPTTSVH